MVPGKGYVLRTDVTLTLKKGNTDEKKQVTLSAQTEVLCTQSDNSLTTVEITSVENLSGWTASVNTQWAETNFRALP